MTVNVDVADGDSQLNASDVPQYSEWKVLPITTLTSIATVVESGILALPVTLYQTSLQLFLIVFAVALAVQISAVYTAIHLIQCLRIDEGYSVSPAAIPSQSIRPQDNQEATSTSP